MQTVNKTISIDVIYIYTFEKFGTLEIDLSHNSKTATRTFDCVFA